MEQRVNKGVTLHDVITSGFSGTFNSVNSNLLTKKEKSKTKSGGWKKFFLLKLNYINHETNCLKRRSYIGIKNVSKRYHIGTPK